MGKNISKINDKIKVLWVFKIFHAWLLQSAMSSIVT